MCSDLAKKHPTDFQIAGYMKAKMHSEKLLQLEKTT